MNKVYIISAMLLLGAGCANTPAPPADAAQRLGSSEPGNAIQELVDGKEKSIPQMTNWILNKNVICKNKLDHIVLLPEIGGKDAAIALNLALLSDDLGSKCRQQAAFEATKLNDAQTIKILKSLAKNDKDKDVRYAAETSHKKLVPEDYEE